MKNLNNRISDVIEYSGYTPSEFADEIDVQRSSISHITSGRNKPSLDFITKIKNRFPEISWDWLIKGNGEMTTPSVDKKNFLQVEDKEVTKPISLPDLFTLIDDKNFGITESEDKLKNEILPDFDRSQQTTSKEVLIDSQPLETKRKIEEVQNTDNELNKIKRVILFFENGKFENYEL